MIEAGKTLQQRYRIDKQIGQGGMGAVYIATDERFGSVVAIKETLCMDSNFRKAIEREARLLNSLKHAALPRVSDHFEENESQFLVMEYIAGDDLSINIEREAEPFSVEQVLDWADQLLDALDFLHTQDIPVIHRDIKPQNLKLTPRGQIVLLDFGLAKGNPTDAPFQTAAKSIFGYSRNYASLEQIQGTGTDPKSDLYSLSATLYHLVTGVAPEDALTRAMSVLSDQPDPLVPAAELRPEIPSGVSSIMGQAMDLNASGRPASAAAMRQMLRDHEQYASASPAIASEVYTRTETVPQIFAQPTRIMPEATVSEPPKATEVKTEIAASNLSEVTKARTVDTTGAVAEASRTNFAAVPAATHSRRPLALAAGIIALLLFGGALAGGIYKYGPFSGRSPKIAGGDQGAANTQSNANTPVVATANESSDVDNVNGSAPGPVPANSKGHAQPPADKQPETAKSTGPAGPQTPKIPNPEPNPADDPTGKGSIGDTNPNPGFPPGPRGGRRPIPGNPFPNGFNPQNMTPQQLRKLRKAIRQGNNPNQNPPN